MAKGMAYLLKKRGNEPSLYTKLDSSHSFGMTGVSFGMTGVSFGMTEVSFGMTGVSAGMTNNAVISTEGRNLYRQESLMDS